MTHSTTTATKRWLLLILAGYLTITFGYSITTPLFEAPDEHWHYFTAQYIADNGRLPTVAPGDTYDTWLSQEAAQPPLYYILGSLLIAPIDTSGAREQVWLNPFARIGNADAVTNINIAVHGPNEAWPWRGYALAAHLLRGFSTLLGLITLLAIFGSARQLWPAHPRRALLATTVTAFLPQFNFLHAAITNDVLIICLASLTIWQLLRLPPNHRPPLRSLLLLGITVGLAALTKTGGILLLLYTLGYLTAHWLRQHPQPFAHLKPLVATLLPVALTAVAIAGWLWLRNIQLYGDPTATEPFIRIAGGDRNYTLWQVLGESSGLWLSLFAIFGWFNLRAPAWVYWLWSGLVAVAAVGALWRVAEAQRRRGAEEKWAARLYAIVLSRPFLLAVWPLLVYAGLVAFMLQTEAAQGRLLFPAIVPLALAVAYGLDALPRQIGTLAPAAALLTTVFSLLGVIRPAYAPPPLVAAAPDTAAALNAEMAPHLTLVAGEVETAVARPGDLATFTLYWQTANPPTQAPEFVLELLGRSQTVVGNLHSYHGRGLYPATFWPPDQIVADRFSLPIRDDAVTPVLAPAFVGIVGEESRVAVGNVKIVPADWPDPAGPPLAMLGDGIWLTQAKLSQTTAVPGDTVTIDVQWQVDTAPGRALTTLIHLAPPNTPPLVTGDSPPLAGSYPTTVWAAGEVINDQYQLTIPADLANGRYPIWIGMYDPNTLERMPLTINNARQPADAYQIGWIEIVGSG